MNKTEKSCVIAGNIAIFLLMEAVPVPITVVHHTH